VRLGQQAVGFAAVAFPDLRPEPEVAADRVRFVQTQRRPHRRAGRRGWCPAGRS
jgi:hypothetical protein